MILNKKNKSVLYIGNFGIKDSFQSSQIKKTISIYNHLINNNFNVIKINTADFDGIKIIVVCAKLFFLLVHTDIIIISLNKNGLRFGNFLILRLLNIFKNKKLYYVTIGGWIAEFINQYKCTINYFRRFECIYVQANKIKYDLSLLGLNNTKNIKNFREFKKDNLMEYYNKIKTINYSEKEKINLLFFASIKKGKGLEIAISAINDFNQRHGNIFALDIIGPVRNDYKLEFDRIMEDVSPEYSYKGVIVYQEKIYEILNSYDFMIFPTYYEGEGFPTVIVESFISGLPVIASDWKYNTEIIKDKYNGLIFESKNTKDLVNKLKWIINNKEKILEMRFNCIKEAVNYHPEVVLEIIVRDLRKSLNFG